MAKTKIINTTPHPLVVFDDDGNEILNIPKASSPFRLDEKLADDGEINNVPVVEKTFLKADDPFSDPEACYYVSFPVAQSFPEKSNLLFAGEIVRDEDGRIKGIKSFARLSSPKPDLRVACKTIKSILDRDCDYKYPVQVFQALLDGGFFAVFGYQVSEEEREEILDEFLQLQKKCLDG